MTPKASTMVSYVNLDADIGGIGNYITYTIREWFFQGSKSGTIYF
jgi:hypothetical protein